MLTSIYPPTAPSARAIPPGEEPLVTRAKVCAQLRAALQILEGEPFDAAHRHLKGAVRVLFVAKTLAAFPGLPAHLRVGQGGRERRA